MAQQVKSRTTRSKDALLDAGIFSKADVDALSAALNEPEWMLEKTASRVECV